ncbi:MAG: M23 family metallopeptidase [Desulfovibrionaceae bacterium]|nr:M23 family metallopeptidase [Desulfovibrionaceae bacterium]
MTIKSICKASFFLSIFFLITFVAYTFFKDLDGPEIAISPETGRLSQNALLSVHLKDSSGIRDVQVSIRKNNVATPIFKKEFTEYEAEQTVDVSFKDVQLREGPLDLEIRATDGSKAGFGQGNTRTVLLPFRFDTKPPYISLKTGAPNVRRGGTGMVRYEVDEEVSISGILLETYFIPSYLQKDGSYVCFFPFPYSMTAQDFKKSIKITAVDLAGNVTQNRLNVIAHERRFKSDKLELTDDFLHTVQTKLYNLAPNAKTPLDCYLTINGHERAANARRLMDIGKDTAQGILWSGNFTPLPRSAARAGFGDHRILYYKNKVVGESYHLGYDFASIRNADVPAANNGRVVFTGDIGIYGNIVIIDHGLGVMSIYSHLNEILAQKGDIVEKGRIIGRTGTTGLAFGDHLHFGILVAGIEVNPLEWIDPKWIRDNITSRLGLQQNPQQK